MSVPGFGSGGGSGGVGGCGAGEGDGRGGAGEGDGVGVVVSRLGVVVGWEVVLLGVALPGGAESPDLSDSLVARTGSSFVGLPGG